MGIAGAGRGWQDGKMSMWWQWWRPGQFWPGGAGLIEILLLTVVFYFGIQFFKGTRGVQVLAGFLGAVVGLWSVTRVLHLDTLAWILQWLSGVATLGAIVIFQPEIRRVLAELGKQRVFGDAQRRKDIMDELLAAVKSLSEAKTGALIALEREIGTRAIQETGTRLDAEVSEELLCTLFFPRTALHDGGVIIEGERIRAAGCVFPLSSGGIEGRQGTRHRAAVGLSEETDAVVIVVSEETGAVSLAFKGKLTRGMDLERLERVLSALYVRGDRKSRWARAQRSLDLTAEGIARTNERMEREIEGNS